MRRWTGGCWARSCGADSVARGQCTCGDRGVKLFGELVQLDGSFHDWFEGRGPRPCLMSLVDDATGTMLGRFGEEETTWGAADVLQAWIGKYGVPQALYTDAKTVYVREPTSLQLAPPPARRNSARCARGSASNSSRALPRGEGRIERNHGTSQDRLVKQMRCSTSPPSRRQSVLDDDVSRRAQRTIRCAAASGWMRTRGSARLSTLPMCFVSRRRGNSETLAVRYANQALQPTRARGGMRAAVACSCASAPMVACASSFAIHSHPRAHAGVDADCAHDPRPPSSLLPLLALPVAIAPAAATRAAENHSARNNSRPRPMDASSHSASTAA